MFVRSDVSQYGEREDSGVARPDHGHFLNSRREFGLSAMNGGVTLSELSFSTSPLHCREQCV